MTETTYLDPEEARLRRHAEKTDKVIGARCAFERGVKLITKERRLDRAMHWFHTFIRARAETPQLADAEIALLQATGFGAVQLGTLRHDFPRWKAAEKSRKAQESRQARGKRGRVKSESDKRLGPRFGGKAIR
jgi:hypothetical protein